MWKEQVCWVLEVYLKRNRWAYDQESVWVWVLQDLECRT